MADLESAIYDILTNDGTVAGLVVTRIYPNVVPQDVSLPAIAYQRLSASREYFHTGPAGYAAARVQITCVDEDYTGAKALAAAVRGALSGYTGTAASQVIHSSFLVNEFDGYGRENDLQVVRQDYMVGYAE